MTPQLRTDGRALVRFVGVITGLGLLFGLMLLLAATGALLTVDYETADVQTEQPVTSFEFQYTPGSNTSDVLAIQHHQGTAIRPTQLAVELTGATCTGQGASTDPNGVYNAEKSFGLAPDNWLAAGMSLVVDDDSPELLCPTGNLDLTSATVLVRWRHPDGTVVILDTWRGPSA